MGTRSESPSFSESFTIFASARGSLRPSRFANCNFYFVFKIYNSVNGSGLVLSTFGCSENVVKEKKNGVFSIRNFC